jgi:hypothetical protein
MFIGTECPPKTKAPEERNVVPKTLPNSGYWFSLRSEEQDAVNGGKLKQETITTEPSAVAPDARGYFNVKPIRLGLSPK